jgi:hypothetical protein
VRQPGLAPAADREAQGTARPPAAAAFPGHCLDRIFCQATVALSSRRLGCEGIVSKRLTSLYRPADRSQPFKAARREAPSGTACAEFAAYSAGETDTNELASPLPPARQASGK